MKFWKFVELVSFGDLEECDGNYEKWRVEVSGRESEREQAPEEGRGKQYPSKHTERFFPFDQ